MAGWNFTNYEWNNSFYTWNATRYDLDNTLYGENYTMYEWEPSLLTLPENYDVIMYAPLVHSLLRHLIIIMGFIGNALTIVIVSNKHSKKSSFTVYLLVLAVVDTVVIIQLIFKIIKFLPDSIENRLCKLNAFLEGAFPQCASWLIVMLTIERAYCTCIPHKARLINRPKTGWLIVCIIVVILTASNVHVFFGYEEYGSDGVSTVCLVDKDISYGEFKDSYWPWIDLAIYCLIPFIIIVICNTATAIAIHRSTKAAHSNFSGRKIKRSHQFTLIAIVLSASFIILGMPYRIFKFYDINLYSRPDVSEAEMLSYFEVEAVVYDMYCLNHGITFYLYVLSGSRFRSQLRSALSCNMGSK